MMQFINRIRGCFLQICLLCLKYLLRSGAQRDILSFHFLIESELVSKSPMAGRKGYTSEWDPNYVPQVVNVMLCFNDFMDKELICVLYPIGVL